MKTYIFLEGKPFEGVSKKTGNPFVLRKIRFADPETFENHQLDFSDKLDLSIIQLDKGDKITLDFTINAPNFGNSDSRVLVTAVKKA